MLSALRRFTTLVSQPTNSGIRAFSPVNVQIRSFAAESHTAVVDDDESGEERIDDDLFIKMYDARVSELLTEFKVPQEQRANFLSNHDFSQGFPTLEWVVSSPPPHHTFEELPIIKEFDH